MLTVTLTPEVEAIVRRKLESGEYGSANEIVAEAVRLLDELAAERDMALQELRTAVLAGADQIERGEFSPRTIKDIIAEGRKTA